MEEQRVRRGEVINNEDRNNNSTNNNSYHNDNNKAAFGRRSIKVHPGNIPSYDSGNVAA